MHNQQQRLEIMSSVQRQMCSANVAYCYLLDSPADIFMCLSYKGWPAVTNLLQGVSRLRGKAFKNVVLMHTGFSRPTPICQGMIDYLNTWGPLIVYVDCLTIWDVDDSQNVEHLNYIEIEPELVLKRNELTLFGTITPPIAPVPHAINLIAGQASHLHRLYMALAYRMAGVRGFHLGSSTDVPYYESLLYQHGHSIGAVLVSASGQVLAKSINTKASNITFHAEVNLIQAFIKSQNGFGQCDAEYVIYTTLKPCRMCAAMISHVLPNAKVIYAQNDPGLHAQHTPSPLHGTVSLEAQSKPLRLYDDEAFDANKLHNSVSTVLDGLRNGPSLTQSIDTSKAGRQMLYASFSVARKVDKYNRIPATTQRGNAVKSVADYLNGMMMPI